MELLLHFNSYGKAFHRTLGKLLDILMPQLELSFPRDLLTAYMLGLLPWESVFR